MKTNAWISIIIVTAVSFLIANNGRAALIFNSGDTVKTENFDGLDTSGTTFPVAGVPFTAWDTTADAAITTMVSGSGTSTTGGIKNVGVAGENADTDRALGSLATGTLVPAFGVNVQNNSGQAIGAFTITYRIEHWRSGNDAGTEVWNFQYAVVGSEISMDTSAASWIDFDPLDMMELNPALTVGAARDGNALGNFSPVGATLSVPLNDGEFLALRWLDANDAGNDATMAIDDFSITAVPEPTNIALGIFALGLLGVSSTRAWLDSRRVRSKA